MRFSHLLNIVGLSLLLASCGQEEEKISTYLLLDNRVAVHAENAELVVGAAQKYENNPLFVEDRPWEQRFDNFYPNVSYNAEEGIYQLWFTPFIVDNQTPEDMPLEERQKEYHPPFNRESAICYATSKDGIHWDKPNTGVSEYNGNSDNNIVWRGVKKEGEHWVGPHGAGVFYDAHETNPAHKYKAFLKMRQMAVGFSADGIHWEEAAAQGLEELHGDTHNFAFWAPTIQKYVAMSRINTDEFGRLVGRMESDDFVHWSPMEMVLKGENKNLQTYSMPVFYYKGVYLGLVTIHHQDIDRVFTELTWSPDTKTWYRISPGTPLILNSENVLDYDYGCVYTSCPVITEDEIRLYYGASNYLHYAWRNGSFCMATLRPDGFAGWEAKDKTQLAKVGTRTFKVKGKHAFINADVVEGGSLKVAVLDEQGQVVPGFSAEDFDAVPAYSVDAEMKWNGKNLSKLNGRKIAFQFELDQAKVYSLSGNME